MNMKPLYLARGAQPAQSFADAYQGAMECVAIWKKRALEAEDLNRKFIAEINGPTYMGEPAQPAPNEQREPVRKAWARFSNELHRSHDAPYPGMSNAFEQHFSQSFTDREWRAESGTWAAAWKAAKRHEAQQVQPAPSVPERWKQMVQELVREVERNTCTHEETHRGGFIWEVCDMCGAKWADDEGGKPEFRWPEVVEKARAMLAAAPEAKP